MTLVSKSPQAERDIEECFVFIGEENLDAGIRFLLAVEDSLEKLAGFRLMGKLFDSPNILVRDLRVWPVAGFGSYLIFYTVADTKITIIRLLHSSRDIEALFDQ